MRKTVYLLIIIILTVFISMSFTGCEKQIKNLNANRYAKEGFRLYKLELYKNAVDQFNKALDENKNLTDVYIYLGTAATMAYKSSILPPEKNVKYKGIEAENQKLQAEIDQAEIFIAQMQSDQTFADLLKDEEAQKKKITQLKEDIKLIAMKLEKRKKPLTYDYYKKLVRQATNAKKRIADNEKFFKQLEEGKNGPKSNDKKDELTGIAAIDAEQKRKETIEIKTEELKNDKETVFDNQGLIDIFEKNDEYIAKNKEIAECNQKIEQNIETLKENEGYEEYKKKVIEIDDKNKLIKYNIAFKEKVEANEKLKNTAIEKLGEVFEADKSNKDAILALSDIYTKMIAIDDEEETYFKEAVRYRKMILDNDPDKAKNFYVMAEFYANHGKLSLAAMTFEERIKLDPKDPDGYHYYLDFLEKVRSFEGALTNHYKRLYATIAPEIIDVILEKDKINETLQKVGKSELYMSNIKKNTALPLKTRNQLIAEKKKQMQEEGIPAKEDLEKQLKEKDLKIKSMLEEAEGELINLPAEKKKALSRIYYAMGVCCWRYCHLTPDGPAFPRERRKEIIDEGFKYLNKTIELDPEYSVPILYVSLMWRQRVYVDPLKSKEYKDKADEIREKYIKLRKRQQQKDAYEKELQKSEDE